MKRSIEFCMIVFAALTWQATAQDFKGAVASPFGKVAASEMSQQIQIQFPAEMVKADAISVLCKPERKGSASWANNSTVWTYNFDDYANGGTKCQISQTGELRSTSGRVWPSGTIGYFVQANGPNVTNVRPIDNYWFSELRETQGLVFVEFDGEIDQASFFRAGNAYLSYLSGNASAEKIELKPVPADQAQNVIAFIKENRELDESRKDWVIASVGRDLIPGAKVTVNVANIVSLYDASIVSEQKYSQELKVRSYFQAKVECARPSETSPVCLPLEPVVVNLNSKVKWPDIKNAYIEYVPFLSRDNRTVRSYAELNESDDSVDYYLRRAAMWVSEYVPYVARFTDTLVSSVKFSVKMKPQTRAVVVIPSQMKDIDGRPLKNTNPRVTLNVGSPNEEIRIPQNISFFEKNVTNVAMPVVVVNLHQKLRVRRSGTDANNWIATSDYAQVVRMIRAYSDQGNYRESQSYSSPMTGLNIANNEVETQLTGQKYRATYVTFPFGKNADGEKGGFYAIEISSPSYEKAHSSEEYNNYFNPQYVLAQLTNLAIHVKRGQDKSFVWVTELDSGKSVGGAEIDIRNCLGQSILQVSTDANGLASFENRKSWASDCQQSKVSNDYTYNDRDQFFVFAKKGKDFTFAHSSWSAHNSYAFGAPGVEYFDSSISEGEPYYHSVIGVNLVKPGQTVPIQVIAKLPVLDGFKEVPVRMLPKTARVYNLWDDKIYFDFPLVWNDGTASFTWTVPSDDSVKLGGYEIRLVNGSRESWIPNSNIEVAEFKIPLMSGTLTLSNQALVKPQAIPVNAAIRYANGIGAKGLPVQVSYYFQSASVRFKKFQDFTFGTGLLQKTEPVLGDNGVLPSEDRPALIESEQTNGDGSIKVDLATQVLSDGKTVAAVLQGLDHTVNMVVRARYQDQMGEYQTLSQAKNIFNNDRFVGTKLVTGDRSVASLQAVLVEASGTPVAKGKQLKLSMYRVETKVIGEEIFGGLIRNTYEREIRKANWTANCTEEQSVMNCPVGNLREGTYAFEVAATSGQAAHVLFKVDGSGRVYGAGDYIDFGYEEFDRQLPLTLNKKNGYKIGDRAVVSFSAPFKECQALVTLERDSVIKAFVVPDACQQSQIQIPIDGKLAPNVFVSVFAIAGRADVKNPKLGDLDMGRPTYRVGFANLKVDEAQYRLDVAVATDKPEYRPGDNVQVKINVKPALGASAPSKVTLVAIEAKILELLDNPTYDVLRAFMQMRYDSVVTSTLLDRVETVTAKNPDGLGLPGADERKGGDEGGGGGSKAELKRKLFDALVAFKTNVIVQNGVATASFKANDSLTKFKIFAIATDSSSRFGTGTTEYLSAQDTQSYANIPPVAYTGDEYPLRVNVQNNTVNAQNYRVEVVATVKDRSGRVVSSKTLTKTQRVDGTSASAIDVGGYAIAPDASTVEYVIHIYDENGNLVDSLQPEAQRVLTTVPLAIHDSFIWQVDAGSLVKTFNKENGALAGKGQIVSNISASLVAGAKAQAIDRAKELGFAESIWMPDRFFYQMIVGSTQNSKPMRNFLSQLVNYLDNDGFIKSYAKANRGNLWLTAELLKAIQSEKWALDSMPAVLKARAAQTVKAVLNKSAEGYIWNNDPNLWFEAQIQFAQLAKIFGDADDNAKASEIAESVIQTDASVIQSWSNDQLVNALTLLADLRGAGATQSVVYYELLKTTRFHFSGGNAASLAGRPLIEWAGYSDETMSSAELLAVYSDLSGQIDRARPLALGVIEASRDRWYIPQTMFWAIEGLKAFAAKYESSSVSGVTNIALSQANVMQSLDWSAMPSGVSIVTPWQGSNETLKVTHAGAGKPWVSVQTWTAVPLTAPKSQGLTIEKSVRNITRSGNFAAGDMVEVTLKIHAAGDARNVILHDPIPAGSNVVGDTYGDFSYSVPSYRGVDLYFDWLSQGETTIKYQYQLNNVGTFNLPPTRAEGVYLKSLFGETPNSTIVVQ